MNPSILDYEKLDQEEASNILLKFAYCLFISVFFIFSINRAVLILLANALINDDLGTAVINRLMGNRNNNEEMEGNSNNRVIIINSHIISLGNQQNTSQRPN